MKYEHEEKMKKMELEFGFKERQGQRDFETRQKEIQLKGLKLYTKRQESGSSFLSTMGKLFSFFGECISRAVVAILPGILPGSLGGRVAQAIGWLD